MVHEKVLEQVDSDKLSVLAVWMPVLQSDNAAAGKAAEPLLPDGGRQFDTKIEEYTLFDAFVTYTGSSEKWRVSVFGKNLTDEIYHSASQYVGGLWTFSTYAPPRTYGVEFGISL